MVCFAEFLAVTDVFERWVSACPLAYRSGDASDKPEVPGRPMPGFLARYRCDAHITAPLGDAVAAQALGMTKVVSEDALRRAPVRGDSGYGLVNLPVGRTKAPGGVASRGVPGDSSHGMGIRLGF